MICVEIVGGDVVESTDVAPDCSQYALMSPTEIDAQTYWANLSMELEPGNGAFFPLVGAMILAYASVCALKFVVRNVRLFGEQT